jgi:release factor glutamine methyltransferase
VSQLAGALADATARLAAAGVPTARVDAELLAAHVWEVSAGRLRAMAVSGGEAHDDVPRLERFAAAVSRRAGREPLQHITGTAPFRHLVLAVGPGVFIPRPETEVTAGLAIEAAGGLAHARVLDAGTGSGAIAAAVALEVAGAAVIAVEIDPGAHAWARRNLDGLPVTLLLADATRLTPADLPGGLVDVLVSNPPYIPDGCEPLEVEVARFDPPGALYGGGADGLKVPGAIVGAAKRLLRPGGVLILEHGAEQGAALRRLAQAHGFSGVRTERDLAGRERVLWARQDTD